LKPTPTASTPAGRSQGLLLMPSPAAVCLWRFCRTHDYPCQQSKGNRAGHTLNRVAACRRFAKT